MIQEFVEVFNKRGNTAGYAVSRNECHKRGLWHQVVHVWYVDPQNNEVLLQVRSLEKSHYAGVKHASAAGHISKGEDAFTTALRETNEELGLKVNPNQITYLGIYQSEQQVPETGEMDREFIHVFTILGNIEINELSLQEEEVSSTTRITLDKFEQEILNPDTISNYLNHPPEYYLDLISAIRFQLQRTSC